MSSSDDSDFEDVGGETFDDMDEDLDYNRNTTQQGWTNVNGKKVRGPDIAWKDWESFDTADEYHNYYIFHLSDT